MAKTQIKTWKDLEVWKLSPELVLKIYAITKTFPKEERYRLVDQLCRSSSSVPTNISEGKGRNSIKEYIQFLNIASGSVEETKYLLLLSKDLGYIGDNDFDKLYEEYGEVGKMLYGLKKSLRAVSNKIK